MARAPVKEYYLGMSRQERAAREYFFDAVNRVLEERGILPVNIEEASVSGLGPKKDYVLMTDAGKLNLSVRDDWMASQFAIKDTAQFRDMHIEQSGKWNVHGFFSEKAHGRRSAREYQDINRIDALVTGIMRSLESLHARVWDPVECTLSKSVALEIGEAKLAKLSAHGMNIKIFDFKRDEEIKFYIDNVTDSAGERPDWLLSGLNESISGRSDTDLMFSLGRWRQNLAKPVEAEAETKSNEIGSRF